jgi:hypothetical protein
LGFRRSKGADAAAKANLSNMRAAGELFYDAGNTYDVFCGGGTASQAMAAAAGAVGPTYTPDYTVVGTAVIAVCHDTSAGWAAQAPLNSGTTFCTDSTGFAAETGSFLFVF